MSLRDEILRHQILLMKLVRTQALLTRKYLKNAEILITNAIESGNYKGLRNKLIMLLGPVPIEALKLIEELALYEAKFTTSKIKKYVNKDAVKVRNDKIKEAVHNIGVRVALNRPPETIKDTYKAFTDTKVNQYMQAISDAKVLKETPNVLKSKIVNLTNGLFTRQNLAIAGVAVIGAANLAREIVTFENKLKVQWSAELDETTCPYCEDQDGKIYKEETDDIPAHSNCRCTWIPIE